MSRLQRFKTLLNRMLEGVCAILLAFMTLLTAYQVFMRYVLKSPSTMSEDILSYSFVWLSLFATALVFGERDHMNLTFFTDKASKKVQLLLSVFTEALIMLVTFIIFLFGGKGFMAVGGMQMSPTLGISMDWIYIILPVSGILIALYNMINVMELIGNYIKDQGGN